MIKYSFTSEFSYQNSHGIKAKFKNFLWGGTCLAKHGIPSKAFHFGGGLGDHLLCTSVFHELAKRGIQNCWMLSHYPEIFQNNPFGLKVVLDDWKTLKLLDKLRRPATLLFYTEWLKDLDQVQSPKNHIILEILKKCNINGEVSLRPYWYEKKIKSPISLKDSYICIQSTLTHSSTPMLNKQWKENRLIECINVLRKSYQIVQLGSKKESKLPLTTDGRGMSIPESATTLANAQFFIGQVGFLMHLARAVDTRSVIIYGGREKAWQSGYPCNENIETSPKCSPCWQNNKCEYDRQCMSDISTKNLLIGVNRLEQRLSQELEIDTATIGVHSKN